MQVKIGILERFKTDGRLRTMEKTLMCLPTDPVVPGRLIDQYQLRPGVTIEVELAPVNPNIRVQQNNYQQQQQSKKNKSTAFVVAPNAPRVVSILKVDGMLPQDISKRRRYEDLTTIDPQPRMTLEYPGCPPACRLIDLFCPIGYGQRAMIVSPPKAGKTTLLKDISMGIAKNHPNVKVIALLIDERPEEVTDFRRTVPSEVLASSNDHTPEKHCALAIMAIERAKRLTEAGQDVVVLLDSLTRVGRAFNTAPGMANTGRTLTGGLDAGALSIPKQLFGAARKFEEGGSLTIIASALVDTGSRGDQVIFEEFKGTGNMELILDRKIAERRIFPAINLAESGTRKEHLLLTKQEFETMSALRRRLLSMPPPVQIEQLLKALERFKTNADLAGAPNSPANA
jgi:transcription termination factor Rho